MRSFQDMPIKRKLTLVMMFISSVALLVTGGVLAGYGLHKFRQGRIEELSALSEVLVANSSAALVFNDRVAAWETLSSLGADSGVLAAFLYTREGDLFARYAAAGGEHIAPPAPVKHGWEFAAGRLALSRPIWLEDERVGSMVVYADLTGQYARLRAYGVILGLALLGSGCLALFLSTRLQRIISEPILDLARVARGVTEQGNYSLRARKTGQDEIGLLIDSFNRMLLQVEDTHAALRRANETLRAEAAERRAAEQALRDSHRFIAGITDASPDILYAFDMPNARLEYVNEQAARLLGWPSREIMSGGPPFLRKHMHPEDRAGVDAWFRRLAAATGNEVIEHEYRVRDAAGNWRWLRTRDTVRVRSDDGLPLRVLGTAADVTAGKQAEQALRESQQRFHQVMEQAADAIFVVDTDSRFVEVNRQACESLGYTRDELLSMTVPEVQVVMTPEKFSDLLDRLAREHALTIEGTHRRKDGAVFPVEVRVGTFLWQGRLHLLALARDIRERKRAQQALRESEERFRQLAENISEVFWLTDPDKQQMIYISPAYEEIWGRTCHSLYKNPRSWLDAIHPDDRQRVLAALPAQRTGDYDIEYRILRPSGAIRWIHDRAFPVHDQHGQVYRIAGIAGDITARKQIELALVESEERWRSLVENARDFILIVDRQARIQYINRALPDFDTRALIGSCVYEYVSADHQAAVAGALEQVFQTGQTGWYETEAAGPRGRPAIYECRAVPIKRDEGVVQVLIIATDITERKRMEREILEISDREQARIGHDLHDGLCQHLIGTGFASRALQQRLAEDGRAEAAEVEQIALMIDDAVRAARSIARGLYPAELEQIGLGPALQQLAADVRTRFRILCAAHCPDNVHIHDVAVATHLYRIAQEAVSNAVKHSRAQNITISLQALNGQVQLTVQDDGTGLPEPSARPAGGMGLHIMIYRANMIGATLEVSGAADGGTSVNCRVRARHARHRPIGEPHDNPSQI
jgi:PAS domain S-box-containing protein